MLIDRAVIEVRSGKGGDGAISFRHEKYVEFGGPDGGNGGKGGSVILVASNDLNTLFNYRHGKALIAEDGTKGNKKLQTGSDGRDYIGKVPVGTVIYDEESKKLLFDLSSEGDTAVVARGGRGGRGNTAFKSSRNRVPRIAENGELGERKRLILELKMLADIAIVGLPSAGKSTFLNTISKANVKTADYPFTTLEPNLGVVTYEDGEAFVYADMPGLIEGASTGKGLGLDFLRHIERSRVLVHLVSMSEENPLEAYNTIRKELLDYGASLEKRPEIIVASKMDVEGANEKYEEFKKALNKEVLPLSCYTREGLKEVLKAARDALANAPKFALKGQEEVSGGMKIYDGHAKEMFTISRPKEDLFIVQGEEVIKKVASINTSSDEGVYRLWNYLNKMGISSALIEKGVRPGDTVQIGTLEFIYSEE